MTSWADSKFDQKIIMATYTYDTNDRLDNLMPFAKLLEERLEGKYEIVTKSFPNVDDLIMAMMQREVDLVFISTAGFLSYSKQGDGFDIAGALMVDHASESTYRSVIAASKESGIINWEDVKDNSHGLKISLVSEKSTSGFLFPLMHFQDHGLTPLDENFRKVEFTGNHRKSLENIKTGDFDIAAFGENDLQTLSENADSIHILWISDPIPLGPVLIRKNLEETVGGEIEHLLFELHTSHPDVLESIKAGWIEARNASHFKKVSVDYYYEFLK